METKIEEVWKDIPENPGFKVSSIGRVLSNGELVPLKIHYNGYYHTSGIKLNGIGTAITVHRLMIWAFFGILTTRKIQCNHKDGNKLNNNISNLEAVSSSQNTRHANNTGLNPGAYYHLKNKDHYKKWKQTKVPKKKVPIYVSKWPYKKKSKNKNEIPGRAI